MLRTTFLAGSIILLATSAGIADEGDVCTSENNTLSAVSQKYKPQFDEVTKDGQKLGDDAKEKKDLSIDVDVKFKEQHWAFDLPVVTIRDQRMVFGIPQVTMKTNDMSFGVPATKMVRTKVGQKPEVYCDTHTLIPKCTVKFTDIFADVPQFWMETKHIKLDVPEVAMRDTQIVMGIPEFKMQRQDWYVKVPEFTLKKIEIAGAPIYTSYASQGKDLENRANGIKVNMQHEVVQDTNNLFSCLRGNLSAKRQAALAQVQEGVNQLQQTANTLKSNGVDPSALSVTIDGVPKTLTIAIADLQGKLISVAKQFDDAAAQLDQNEKDAVTNITSQ
jgi:hypothetical protein